MKKKEEDKEFQNVLRALDDAFLPFGTVEQMELHGTQTIVEKLHNAASIRKEELERALLERNFQRKMCEGNLCWVVYIKE